MKLAEAMESCPGKGWEKQHSDPLSINWSLLCDDGVSIGKSVLLCFQIEGIGAWIDVPLSSNSVCSRLGERWELLNSGSYCHPGGRLSFWQPPQVGGESLCWLWTLKCQQFLRQESGSWADRTSGVSEDQYTSGIILCSELIDLSGKNVLCLLRDNILREFCNHFCSSWLRHLLLHINILCLFIIVAKPLLLF